MLGGLGRVPAETALSRLLEHPTRTFTPHDLRGLGQVGELLRRWGALEELEPPAVIRCRACDEDHEVDLEFDHHTGGYRYYCGSVGFVRAEDDDVRVFRFDHVWLISRLSAGLRIARPRHRELVASALWDLGDADLGEAGVGGLPWAVFLARRVLPSLDAIIDALQTRGRKLPGFVLTSSADAPWHLVLPHGYRFVPLEDVLESGAATLAVSLGTLLSALGGRATGKRETPGRPTDKAIILDLFERRKRAGLTFRRVGREADAIAAELPAVEHADVRGTAAGTVENIIRRPHRAWREAVPRSTK